jgi:PleD family two-component response regulator
MGLAEIREGKAKTDVILNRADQALYKARESGRDRLAANDSICGQDGKTRLKPGLS